MELKSSKLVLCYVSGFDLRGVDRGVTPFFAEAMARYPRTTSTNLPSNELFPTLVTGVDPTEHRVWGVRIRDPLQRARLRSPRHRGNVGHLPQFEVERSFALLLNAGFAAGSIAPSSTSPRPSSRCSGSRPRGA